MISYAPFWKTIAEKQISTYALVNHYNISSATISRLKHNQGITTTKIDDLCKILNCQVSDILEYIPDNKPFYYI